jgi:Amt family ammonium transporter
LIKNWLDMCFGALVYWATGYAFMYGSKGNSFISYSYFFLYDLPGRNVFIYG